MVPCSSVLTGKFWVKRCGLSASVYSRLFWHFCEELLNMGHGKLGKIMKNHGISKAQEHKPC